MRKLQLVSEVSQHELMKPLHGIVYRHWDRSTTVTAVIPLNYIMRLFYTFWYALKAPSELWWERRVGRDADDGVDKLTI